jgi:ElaB/YqjD/DUF883 family membrane-anchored ribosome-binding protein
MKNNHTATEQSKSNVQHHAEGIAEAVKKDSKAMKEKAEQWKDQASEKAEETWEELKAKTTETQGAVAQYVKDNPFKALGWAALAGAVLGILCRK